MVKKQRSDADRRVRQCERLGRLLRVLHLIMGKGGWDANTLAAELECSKRTVYRLLQTLSLAGVPWYFDEACRSYRVRPGFKFTGLDGQPETPRRDMNSASMNLAAKQLLVDGEKFMQSLRAFCHQLNGKSVEPQL